MNTKTQQSASLRRGEGEASGLFGLWIGLIRWVHVTTGRELQRYAVWRLQRRIEATLREEGERTRWN